MNKILLSVFFAFSISIAFFYIFQENFPPQKVSDVEDHDFFNEQLGTNSKKFLMLGGSGTAQLNSTMIDNLLKNLHIKYAILPIDVYLKIFNDYPQFKRLVMLTDNPKCLYLTELEAKLKEDLTFKF